MNLGQEAVSHSEVVRSDWTRVKWPSYVVESPKTAAKRRKYDAAFRAKADRRVAEHGQP
jgi:hypothetical protein